MCAHDVQVTDQVFVEFFAHDAGFLASSINTCVNGFVTCWVTHGILEVASLSICRYQGV
jgi:hypothetical protein